METETERKPTATITLPAPVLKSVRALAKRNARSLSNQMARLVELGLERSATETNKP